MFGTVWYIQNGCKFPILTKEVQPGDEAIKCFSTEERGQRLLMLISDADGFQESGGNVSFMFF